MRIFPLIAALLALAYLAGGAALIAVGGSWFYALSGVWLAVTAVLLWRGDQRGSWVFAGLVAITLVWALAEAGLDAWALLPRVWIPLALGAWLLLPVARRRLTSGPSLRRPRRAAALVATVIAVVGLAALLGRAARPVLAAADPVGPSASAAQSSGDDWGSYGGAPGGTRFSRLGEITPTNVGRLRVAWTYHTREAHNLGLEVTPIEVGGVVYLCTAANLVIALDAETGVERWRYDPHVVAGKIPGVCRGVVFYRVPGLTGACAERIFTNTFDARLIALDALSGRPCAGFGREGVVSLTEGMRPVHPGTFVVSSAPTLARGKLVVGGAPLAVKGFDEPSGVIRAYDAITGKLAWAYDAGRPDRTGAPAAGEFYTVGMPNAWAAMSYDDALGLVYVPTATGGAAYFGGTRRPVDDEISTAVMALDVETGRRRWIYQVVHHDLWDYDVPTQPVLADLREGGRVIKALVQPTKMGETFILDRATGVPIEPVIERRVPQRGKVADERLSPTQPFPTRMPSLSGGLLTEQKMWGLTPFDQMWCRIKFREARYEGPMTPPGVTANIESPGWLGGMDWGGASIDPERGVMLAVTNYVANYVRMSRVDPALAASGGRMRNRGELAEYALQADVPYANSTLPFLSPLRVPCQQPPWSRLSAIDLVHHRVLWSRPLGTGKDNGPLGVATGVPIPIGVPALGGSLVTRSGLTFVGASTDRTFRAFDTATGRVLWRAGLPASANASPITYRSPSGRQIVLTPAGGHKILGGQTADAFIAYALAPERS